MTEAFKRLNYKNELLAQENLQLKDKIAKMENDLKTKDKQGFPSSIKMDEMGVHSPLNVNKSTVSNKDTASPAQTVVGKDLSNPLMAGSSSRRRLPISFSQKIRQKTKKITRK